MKKLSLIAILIFIKSIAFAQNLVITNTIEPYRAGERVLTFKCPTEGIPQKDIEVWVYYSDSKEQLSKPDCPRGRATLRKNSNDPSNLECRFYFPHRDFMKPNFILQREREGGNGLTSDESEEFLTHILDPSTHTAVGNQYNPLVDYTNGITDKNPKSINNPAKVYYKIVRERKAAKKATEILEFAMPRVFVIGYMGDSYTSGEGAPYSGSDKWDDDFCHRSNKSGGMMAINKLIRINRELALRVINTTCSGAKIGNLINNRQERGNTSRKPQLDQIADWCKETDRETVDILMMGIGGNSIGFAPLATAAIVPPGVPFVANVFGIEVESDWSNFDKLQGETMKALGKLAGKYEDLNTAIENQDYTVGEVVMMNYPNMLFGKNRELCDGKNTTGFCLDPGMQLYGHINFFREIHTRLNEEIRLACEKYKWNPVRVSAINKHGICNCEAPYFNSLPDSYLNQGDANGAIHPNADGYKELYEDNVFAVLKTVIPNAQEKDYQVRREKAKADIKAELKKDQQKKIAKEEMKRKLREKNEADRSEGNAADSIKFEIPKDFKPNNNQVKPKTPDEPRKKQDENEKD